MSEEVSKEDLRRCNHCDHYLKTKQIMKNAETYKELAIGEVYYIKYKDYQGIEVYETANTDDPSKFMVFHKDEGFVFVKRIIASGQLGKEVTCLTTTYDVGTHWLEADPDYVNSILLADEAGYDPMAATKKLSSNKNKARRRNKKLEIKFNDTTIAYNYVDTLKVGDRIYDANTSYGSGVLTWQVTKVDKRKANHDKPTNGYYRNNAIGSTNEDQLHNKYGFKDLVAITIKIQGDKPKARRYESDERIVTFDDFTKSYRTYYKNKPYTVDDV